jgi:RND family efflux transporter MFP subunit
MNVSRKAAALSVGLIVALSAASMAQNPGTAKRGQKSPGETIVIAGEIDWIEKSDVSALTEGVVRQIEFQVGDRVEKGKEIGFLHDERAKLAVAKAKLAAENVGAIEKGKAQRQLAIAEKARMVRANKLFERAHSVSELEKADAEIMVAEALVKEATENQSIAKAELAIAHRQLEEHVVTAPFTGYVMERMKNPGESVRANEAIVRLGRIDKLRFHGFVPLEGAFRIKLGDLVDVRPTVEGAELPIEQRKFRGKVSALAREISSVGKTEVMVLAEIDNPEDPAHPDLALSPGMKADMTIYLTPAAGGQPVVGARLEPKPTR